MDNAKKKNNKINNHSYNEKYNSRSRIEKLTLTALFTAIAVGGSTWHGEHTFCGLLWPDGFGRSLYNAA